MAKLSKALQHVKSFPVSNIEYYGIQRKFFPKWEGWDIIDSGEIPDDKLVSDFYNIYFWAKLRGDEIYNQELAELIFLFSITNGKKKAIEKLDRVFGSSSDGLMTSFIIHKINNYDVKFLFMFFYAELCEFCIMLDKKKDFCRLLRIYNEFVNKILS